MAEQHISSRRNPVVREAAALGKDAEKRRESGRFLCEGARLCADAALSGLEIETCFLTERAAEKYREYLEPVRKASRAAFVIEEPVALLLADTRTPQGVFCVCRRPETGNGPALPENCMVLEDLQDPGNLGTVLRTAEALGMKRVFLLGDCCDPFSPKALRASMGAVFRLTLTAERSAQRLKELLEGQGYLLHAAVPDSSAERVTAIDFSRGLHAVLIGNEGSGLRPETAALCHDRVTIPMGGRAESLNASAAATILLWEMCRQGAGGG